MDALEGISANSTLLMSFRSSRVNLFNCPAETIPQREYSIVQLYLTRKAARATGNPALPELLSGLEDICNRLPPNQPTSGSWEKWGQLTLFRMLL